MILEPRFFHLLKEKHHFFESSSCPSPNFMCLCPRHLQYYYRTTSTSSTIIFISSYLCSSILVISSSLVVSPSRSPSFFLQDQSYYYKAKFSSLNFKLFSRFENSSLLFWLLTVSKLEIQVLRSCNFWNSPSKLDSSPPLLATIPPTISCSSLKSCFRENCTLSKLAPSSKLELYSWVLPLRGRGLPSN